MAIKLVKKSLFSISKFTRAMDRAYKKNPRSPNVQKFVKFQKFFRMKCEDIFVGLLVNSLYFDDNPF